MKWKIWIRDNSYIVLFEIGWNHYAAINFYAIPFSRINKRKKIKRSQICSTAFRYYTKFPDDVSNYMIAEVRYVHEFYNLLYVKTMDKEK